MSELRIGEVAKRTGLASSAIRYYESEGLIRRADRRGGRRVYNADVLNQLSIIELAKRSGFTIVEIKHLLGGFSRQTPPGERWRKLAETKLRELSRHITEAQRMRNVLRVVMRCECPTFDDCARAMKSRTRAGKSKG